VPYPGLSEPSASVGGTQVPVQRPGSVLPPPPPPPLSVAEQVVAVVLVPPLIPLQPHVQGPEPETAVALVPATQRFVEGALANDPPLVFADEPTGNLDSKTGQVIYELLEEIARERTVIVVTHAEPLAQRAKRVIYIQDGRLVS